MRKVGKLAKDAGAGWDYLDKVGLLSGRGRGQGYKGRPDGIVAGFDHNGIHCCCFCIVPKSYLTLATPELQHVRLPCSSVSPAFYSNSYALSQ